MDMLFATITVPFDQLANFTTFVSAIRDHVETAFSVVGPKASIVWLMKTDFLTEEDFDALRGNGIGVEFFKENEEQRKLDGSEWAKGLDLIE